jgi:hypothetical protein
MEKRVSTVILASKAAPPCECGRWKVSVFQDGLEDLMDNMGCELGLQFLGGPFCPVCEAGEVEQSRRKALGSGPQA